MTSGTPVTCCYCNNPITADQLPLGVGQGKVWHLSCSNVVEHHHLPEVRETKRECDKITVDLIRAKHSVEFQGQNIHALLSYITTLENETLWLSRDKCDKQHLEQKLAELEKDKERLDWLEKRDGTIHWSNRISPNLAHFTEINQTGVEQVSGGYFRETIDSAIAQEKSKCPTSTP